MPTPVIPEYITVHLGEPSDTSARNIVVPFIDYIKNVASSEIYPTWPEAALRANILAQITYALNRVYTEWYKSQGYNFDITSSTRYDQKFIEGRDYFDNVVKIVDDMFNDYVVKQGSIQPYFTQYCSGKEVTCEGLSQWGTVSLADQGYIPYEILQYYYGDDINIINDAPIQENVESYPGISLRIGSSSNDVRTIQRQLNRIGDNYPAIPKIPNTNGIFGIETENAVKKFQEIFNIAVDGIVGKSTWYKIKFIYNNVKKLSELYSEGLTIGELERIYPNLLQEGDVGESVEVLQYYLAVIGYFDNQVPQIVVDGTFGQNTKNAVIAFQREYGLPETGILDRSTWNQILRSYDETIKALPEEYKAISYEIYPGRVLSRGIIGNDVGDLQQLLRILHKYNPAIPNVEITGTFDDSTYNAVRTFQKNYGLTESGTVGPITWARLVEAIKNLMQSSKQQSQQFATTS